MLANFFPKKARRKISDTVATTKPQTPSEYKVESFQKTKNVFTIIEMKTKDLISGAQRVPWP